jgi:adenine-specific DNA-methyltransferase
MPKKTIKVARPKTRKPAAGGGLAAVRHKDSRVNIPTEELRGFVREEDQKKTVLYPRNPDIDPQLVWRGKDEQDSATLEVPSLPVYIQEKIDAHAIIADFKRIAKRKGPPEDPWLIDPYAAFNGLPKDFAERVDFYKHSGHWQNRLILGDSLLVMTSLAEKEGLKGRVQMIYFDPPYGIKFGSNWQVSTRKREVKDGKAEDVVRQPEQIKAFRDTWFDGIHTYLAYLRDRLTIAHQLLTETGSIFVQIGDENVHLVRSVMEEVFGKENFVVTIVVKKKGATTERDPVNDYVLWVAKDRKNVRSRRLFIERRTPDDDTKFNTLISPAGEHVRVKTLKDESAIESLLNVGYRWARVNWPLVSQDPSPRSQDFILNGKRFKCGPSRHWTFDPDTQMKKLQAANRLFDGGGESLGGIVYWDDWPYVVRSNMWEDLHGEQDMVYVVQTNRRIVERCLLMTTDPGDLVLDPTCGSGTAAFVAEQWGRRWITTDTSRVALTLARTRLMSARFPYYVLAEQYPQVTPHLEDEKIKQTLKTAPPALPDDKADIRKGFVYKRVPQVTLKSIADNPDIREGMSREEIDGVVTRHAEFQPLFDKPYEDPKRIRVTGPFTVESLSPHRTISTVEKVAESRGEIEGVSAKVFGPDEFGRMVLENMKKAGVQNTYAKERMVFEALEPHAGEWIQGAGEYTGKDGKRRRVAVCIGPEHGTVGPDLIKEAAKEAVKGVGFDTLLVAGFAFDPHVGEESKRYGNLTVLPVRINSDLAMGELLKKTGAGNLFMIFGEPDVKIRGAKKEELGDVAAKASDHVVIELRGLDVYDPTTGELRPSSTDDIACWFIDTEYNGESFFVRHAYFTGAGEPYDKLKRALRAEIDEGAWAALYSTTSRPFPKPETGRIAVKVINHYGDEVLQVYPVR